MKANFSVLLNSSIDMNDIILLALAQFHFTYYGTVTGTCPFKLKKIIKITPALLSNQQPDIIKITFNSYINEYSYTYSIIHAYTGILYNHNILCLIRY